MKKIALLLASSLVCCFLSCSSSYEYYKKYEVSGQQWTYDDSFSFEIDIADTVSIYNLFLDIEHSTDYPNQNIYIAIHTQFPNGQKLKETLSIDLANKTGQWYGDCNSQSCLLQIPIQEGAYFNAAGAYTFTIEQYMRINPLPAIHSIAFMLEDTGKDR